MVWAVVITTRAIAIQVKVKGMLCGVRLDVDVATAQCRSCAATRGILTSFENLESESRLKNKHNRNAFEQA